MYAQHCAAGLAVGNVEQAISFANDALAMANKSGYRYYARSRHLPVHW